MAKMKVRFAPSPTGPFHIGGARSALFNWLLARKEGGTFLLRIEDTDLARSTRESEENIKAALKWLGMDWDEGIDVGGEHGPYRQTERGHVSFESNGVGDFVIVKSDGIPVYNYAVVIDDHTMEVTHVIRAEEHLSNTPRQIAIYNALGWEVPTFGHISLILGKDYKKMSKRHGATSVDQYRQLGYLPEAIDNFLALLGWAPDGEQELFTQEELIQNFSMDRVAKNPAVFDIDKLNWINFNYMKNLSDEELYELCLPHLQEAGYASENPDEAEKAKLIMLCVCLKDHISFGAQIKEEAKLIFEDMEAPDAEHAEEIKAVLAEESCPTVLNAFRAAVADLDEITPDVVKATIKGIMKETKLKGKFVFMPIRIATTGQMHGPDLNYIITLFGKEKTLARLDAAISQL